MKHILNELGESILIIILGAAIISGFAGVLTMISI